MTKRLAVSGIAQCILGVAILVVASPAAKAQTTTLICNLDHQPDVFKEDEPTTIDLNEAQNTVAVHLCEDTIHKQRALRVAFERYTARHFRCGHHFFC
jgi:hypothetical protein